jgi:rhodanese-related sulfurtransferase
MTCPQEIGPADEYRSAHIPGAISIPLKELEAHFFELPKDQEIVAYCRDPYCVLAMQEVEFLRKKGLRAVRLEEGVQERQAQGLPVAIGEEG